jgi:ABC-type glycerol-3-phosphate transport system substrate-binding protein
MGTDRNLAAAAMSKELSRRDVLKLGAAVPVGAALMSTIGSTAVRAQSASEDFSGVTIRIACNPTVIKAAEAAAPMWAAATGGTAIPEVVPFAERAIRFAGLIVNNDPAFDLLYAAQSFVRRFGDRLYLPLADVAGDTSDFIPITLGSLSVGGALLGLPVHSEMQLFIYNKEMFQAAGVDPDNLPGTWDEMFALAGALTDGDREACVVPWLTGLGLPWWYCKYNSTPGELFNDDRTQVLFDNEYGVAAWETLAKGFESKFYGEAGSNAPSDYDTGLLFNQGLAASQINVVELWGQATSGDVENFKATIDPAVVGVKILPGITAGTSGSANATEGFGISRFSANPEAALSFLKFVTGVEYQTSMVKGEGGFLLPSSRISVLSDPSVQESFPIAPVLVEQGGFNLDNPAAPYDLQAPFQTNVTNLYRGEATAQEAHDGFVQAVNDSIVTYLSE